ncbi:hypothetical protein SAMN05877809_106142 [Rhodobacter sp. JA431]|uniref:hypothetical protein n=1 Tax=Rhodobacter sp. JA431 TaxID=570013 RepID=UPI000BC5DD37|nr:hypothetical protein [Rhodobacter sp. JA431]SOC12770.1 hypothetical protein SAMN05877809_106142 [Rhodobacter sp. JA431]
MPPFAQVLPRFLLVAPVALAACVEGMPADPSAPRISQRGTCFAYVAAEAGGQYALVTGKGDGTREPPALKTNPMGAAAVDAAFARELKAMQVMPECLAIYAKSRAEAAPYVAPEPATKS